MADDRATEEDFAILTWADWSVIYDAIVGTDVVMKLSNHAPLRTDMVAVPRAVLTTVGVTEQEALRAIDEAS